MLYETSKLNKAWSVHTFVNNSMRLGFSFLFHFEVSCTNKPLILFYNEREHDKNTVRRKILTGENIDEFPAIRQYFPYQKFPFS